MYALIPHLRYTSFFLSRTWGMFSESVYILVCNCEHIVTGLLLSLGKLEVLQIFQKKSERQDSRILIIAMEYI